MLINIRDPSSSNCNSRNDNVIYYRYYLSIITIISVKKYVLVIHWVKDKDGGVAHAEGKEDPVEAVNIAWDDIYETVYVVMYERQ